MTNGAPTHRAARLHTRGHHAAQPHLLLMLRSRTQGSPAPSTMPLVSWQLTMRARSHAILPRRSHCYWWLEHEHVDGVRLGKGGAGNACALRGRRLFTMVSYCMAMETAVMPCTQLYPCGDSPGGCEYACDWAAREAGQGGWRRGRRAMM